MTSTDEKELTFIDLVVLQRVGPDTTLERFGSKINSSFFDAANILGTIKLKGYVDIESSMGASRVSVSEAGKAVLSMAEEKSQGEVDELDKGILRAISQGVKDSEKLADSLNIRSGDLAYHLYKLVKQNYIDYNVRSGRISLMLTENGFKSMGEEKAQTQVDDEENLGAEIAKEEKEQEPSGMTGNVDIGEVRRRSKLEYYLKKRGKDAAVVGAAVIVIILLLLFYFVF